MHWSVIAYIHDISQDIFIAWKEDLNVYINAICEITREKRGTMAAKYHVSVSIANQMDAPVAPSDNKTCEERNIYGTLCQMISVTFPL